MEQLPLMKQSKSLLNLCQQYYQDNHQYEHARSQDCGISVPQRLENETILRSIVDSISNRKAHRQHSTNQTDDDQGEQNV